MWLSATTMMAVLDDIGRSVASTAAKKIMFINGHGGNSALVAMMNRELRLKYGLQTFLAHPHMPADQGGSSAESELGMGVHGGVDETSVMLHLRPEGLASNEQVKFGGRVAFGWLSNDFFPEGHIGDPTGASAELGARMFAGAVDSLGVAMKEISRFDFGR
jgi:creatinine amidohydrolase